MKTEPHPGEEKMSKANSTPRNGEARISESPPESSTAGLEHDLYEAFRIYAAETGADRELDFDPEQDFDVWYERRVMARLKQMAEKAAAELAQAIINGAQIALELGRDPNADFDYHGHDFALEQIAAAALDLARIEIAEPNLWERAFNDYETTCAKIAGHLAGHHRAPNRSEILDIMNGGLS